MQGPLVVAAIGGRLVGGFKLLKVQASLLLGGCL